MYCTVVRLCELGDLLACQNSLNLATECCKKKSLPHHMCNVTTNMYMFCRPEDVYACARRVPVPVCAIWRDAALGPLHAAVCDQSGQGHQCGTGSPGLQRAACLQDRTGCRNVSLGINKKNHPPYPLIARKCSCSYKLYWFHNVCLSVCQLCLAVSVFLKSHCLKGRNMLTGL